MSRWLNKKISGFSYKYFLIAGMTLFAFIIAAFFFAYTLHISKSNYLADMSNNARFDSNLLVSRVDERLNTFEKYYIASMVEDEITWILTDDFSYSDYSRYKAVMDNLSTRKMFISYLDSYALVDFNSGWVISKKGLMKQSELSNPEVLQNLYNKGSEINRKRFWYYSPVVENTNNTTTVDPNARTKIEADGLCLVMRLPVDSINSHALAVIKVNMETWKKWIKEELPAGKIAVVCDDMGNIIYSTDENYNELAKKIAATSDTENTYTEKAGKNIVIASQSVSDILGWHYVLISVPDKKIVFGNASHWVVMAVLLIAIVIGFTAIAYAIYKPINGIMEDITGDSDIPEGNEFKYITNHLSMLKDDKQALEKMVENQQSNIEEMLERRLINEGIKSNEEWNDYFQSLKLVDYKCYSTMVMVLDIRNEDQKSVLDEDAICLEIIQKMPAELKALLWMTPIYNSSAIFAVVGADEENELLDKIMKFYEGLKQFAMNTTGYSILAGVSSSCHDHKHFRRAYRESVNALTKQGYETSEEDNENDAADDCRFYIASKPSLTGSAYSNSFENDIRLAVKEVDRHKAYQTTDRFCEFLATVQSNDVASLYIMRYVNSIILTAIEANINPEEIFGEGVRQNYMGLLAEIEPRQVRKFIKKNFIDPVVDRLTEKMQKESYNVMESIDALLERTKGNLLLAECADELGVHQTYIWKILKMEKGKSFTEYAEKYKIEEAKKLLLQTNMSVQEIAAALDYANAQNFIRFFSKVTGVTPGKFRKLY